jgi:hypothetical protein
MVGPQLGKLLKSSRDLGLFDDCVRAMVVRVLQSFAWRFISYLAASFGIRPPANQVTSPVAKNLQPPQ